MLTHEIASVPDQTKYSTLVPLAIVGSSLACSTCSVTLTKVRLLATVPPAGAVKGAVA